MGPPFFCYVWPMVLPVFGLVLLFQSSLVVEILRQEDGRVSEVSQLTESLRHNAAAIRRLAVRALGRLERSEHAPSVQALVKDPDPTVRAAAYLALLHLKVDPGLKELLEEEQDPQVRARMLEALGRLDGESEADLRRALEGKPDQRTAALRGLDALVRQSRAKALDASTLRSLSRISGQDTLAWNRRLALTIMLALGKQESVDLGRLLSDSWENSEMILHIWSDSRVCAPVRIAKPRLD